MKKALLLSVVASSMIMAGGDIAPVEPAVETPAPAVSGWEFSGTGVVYYQTSDTFVGTVAA
ncbi:MAG TPA: outer membrane porin, OprD family, partial [Epsilonproteobacteria bacterium]|nr:outer membrane porin, OprD family [Campylobacterota bacterium]